MTIADLEQLLREYIPDPCAGVNGRGRASVMAISMRYEMPEDRNAHIFTSVFPPCPVCHTHFERKTVAKIYCSDACKQKAYRERKKKQSA